MELWAGLHLCYLEDWEDRYPLLTADEGYFCLKIRYGDAFRADEEQLAVSGSSLGPRRLPQLIRILNRCLPAEYAGLGLEARPSSFGLQPDGLFH